MFVLSIFVAAYMKVLQKCSPFVCVIGLNESVCACHFRRCVLKVLHKCSLFVCAIAQAPNKPSGYLTGMLRPLQIFCDEHAAALGESHHREILLIIFSSLVDQ